MNRGLLVAVALCACLGAAVVLVVSLLTGDTRIDPDHFQAIEVGMPQTEVEQLLGGSPRNECLGPVHLWVRREGGLQSAELDSGTPTARFFPAADAVKGEEAVWVSEAGLIAVTLPPLLKREQSSFHTRRSAPSLWFSARGRQHDLIAFRVLHDRRHAPRFCLWGLCEFYPLGD